MQDVLSAIISYMYDDDSLFDKTRMTRETLHYYVFDRAIVRDGINNGGVDDGLPLFEKKCVRSNTQSN